MKFTKMVRRLLAEILIEGDDHKKWESDITLKNFKAKIYHHKNGNISIKVKRR